MSNTTNHSAICAEELYKAGIDNPFAYLINHGLPLERIESLKKGNVSYAEQALAIYAHLQRGGTMEELLKEEAMHDSPEPPQEVKPTLIRASDVPYEPPRWLIAPYIQKGKGTLIQADNGTGKTAFVCAIAAHIFTGRPLLDIPITTPGDVLILSVEDDLPILRGRIEASGGDLTHCHFISNAAGLNFNSPEVESAIKQINAKLVIFDPLQAFMSAKVDMFRANETRPELAKLFDICDRNDCACIIIAHIGKSMGTNPQSTVPLAVLTFRHPCAVCYKSSRIPIMSLSVLPFV